MSEQSTAPTLPGTSNNGITGVWSPATINTATAGTTTYTFTPATGQCALPFTMNIVITTLITPTFTRVGPLCQNSTAPTLPGTSNNGITGVWSPATISTATAGTTTYTFTPAAGQCATPVTMNIVITTQITPTFTQLGPLCQNLTAPTLPGTSNNGITGVWSPATINTATAGTTTYTFTPAAGQCALPFTMNIVITTLMTPTFTQLVRSVRTQLHQHCLVLLTMVSLVYGHLLLSVQQLPVPLLIHLRQLPVSVLCHLQ